MKCVYTLLAHCTAEHVNSTVSPRDLRTPLHLACALGNVAIAQLLIWVSAMSNIFQWSLSFIVFSKL